MPAARLLPPIKDADASGELELCADDILESNDIDTFEVAAAGIQSFRTPAPTAAPAIDARPVPPPAPGTSPAFEVCDVAAFEDIEVEGGEALAPEAREPSVSIRVEYTSPQPSTLIGMPAAPITSPLPLEQSVPAAAPAERTQEMKGDIAAKVAEAAAFLDGDIPEQTQVLVRADMPASIQAPRAVPGGRMAAPGSVQTPSSAFAATAPAWKEGGHPASGRHPVSGQMAAAPHVSVRPSSIAPVALDVNNPLPQRGGAVSGARPPMHSSSVASASPAYAARPAKSGGSGLLIGGLVFAAAALIGVVGVGGYMASRTLSDKAPSLAIAPAPEPAAAAPQDPAAAPADPAAAPADPVAAPVGPAVAEASPGVQSVPPSTGIDVSSLPAAPARGAVAPVALAATGAPGAPRVVVVGPSGVTRAGSSPVAPISGGRSGAPLPPPGAGNAGREAPLAAGGGAVALPPPPSKVAPAAAAPVATSTGNVNVDPKLRAIVVDGGFRRVNDGVLTLSCGTHRIKVGMNDTQVVNVPCGGSVSL